MASPTSSMSDVSEINESFNEDIEDYNLGEQCGQQQQQQMIDGIAAYQDELGQCQENQSLAYDSLCSAQDRLPQTSPLPNNFNCLYDDMASLSISGGGKQPEIDLNAAIERQRLKLDRFKEAHLQKQLSIHQQQAMLSTSTSYPPTPRHIMPTHSLNTIPSDVHTVSYAPASSDVSNITSKSEALSRAYKLQRKEYERLQKEHMKKKHQQNSNQPEMAHSAALCNQKQQQQSINHQEVTGSSATRMDRSSAASRMSSLVQNDRGVRQTESPQTPPPNYNSMDNHLESTHHTYPTRQGDRSGEMIPPTAVDEEELSEELFNHYLDLFNETKFNPAPGF